MNDFVLLITIGFWLGILTAVLTIISVKIETYKKGENK